MTGEVLASIANIERRDDFHLCNCPEDHPVFLILALILRDNKSLPISIYRQPFYYSSSSSTYDDWFSIYTKIEGARALDQIENTPEYRALSEAYSGFGDPPDFSECCQWDDKTKTRILVRYWQHRAIHYQHWANCIIDPRTSRDIKEKNKAIREVENALAETSKLSSELDTLTLVDVHSLLEEVVDRVLVPS